MVKAESLLILKRNSANSALTSMLIAALLTVAKRQKHPKCPSTDEQVNKYGISILWTTSQPIKRSKILTHAAMWMNLENKVKKPDIIDHKINDSTDVKYPEYINP